VEVPDETTSVSVFVVLGLCFLAGCGASSATTGRFTFTKHTGNLGKGVLEDFEQQEIGSFKRLELL
jgi:hypothetical protein